MQIVVGVEQVGVALSQFGFRALECTNRELARASCGVDRPHRGGKVVPVGGRESSLPGTGRAAFECQLEPSIRIGGAGKGPSRSKLGRGR